MSVNPHLQSSEERKSESVVLFQTGDLQIWKRAISPKGSLAIAFLNFLINGGGAKEMQTTLSRLGLNRASGYNVTEGFTGEFIGVYKPTSVLSVMVNPSGVYLVVAKPLS